jgi:hypothetical protein
MSDVECDGWEAWYNRMPGTDDRDLRVVGICHLPSSNIQASLERADDLDLEPKEVALRLQLTRPPVGDTRIDDRPVRWQEDVGADVERVRIVGDAEASIKVEIRS